MMVLCNPNDSIFERFACFLGIFFKRVIEVEGGSCKTSMETEVFTATEFPYFIQIFGWKYVVKKCYDFGTPLIYHHFLRKAPVSKR